MLSKLLAFLNMAKPGRKTKPDCDSSGNSEESLIALLKSILVNEFKEVNDSIQEYRTELAAKETRDNERHQTIMTALEDLQAALNEATTAQTDLTTAVNAAIVKLGTTPVPVDEAAITAAAVAVRANSASDVVLKDALNAALGNPPPTP